MVYAEALDAASHIGTLGVALSVCTLPGKTPSSRLSPSQGSPDVPDRLYEVGMGIHGEAGREQRELPFGTAADTVADIMIEGMSV